jgi:hypothetical protein
VREEPLLLRQWPAASTVTVTGPAHATGRNPAFSAARGARLQHARIRFPRAFGRLIGHRRLSPEVSRARSFAATRALFVCATIAHTRSERG